MKKIIPISLMAVITIAGYLYWSHWHIYHHLKQVGLRASNSQTSYRMSTNQATTEALTYIALGDSLTSGMGVTDYAQSYPYLVADKLSRAQGRVYDLQSLSYPGYRTIDLINNFLARTIEIQPDIITVLIGVNDIHGQVDQTVFEKAYRYLLDELTKRTKARVYVISIPYIGSDTLLLPPYNVYFRSQTTAYNKIIARLASEYQVAYIDIDTPTSALFQNNGSHYSADSFHPSAEGYALWAEIIYASLNR